MLVFFFQAHFLKTTGIIHPSAISRAVVLLKVLLLETSAPETSAKVQIWTD